VFLLIRHSKYRAILSKIHSYGVLFQKFCPLGIICIALNIRLFIDDSEVKQTKSKNVERRIFYTITV